MTTETGSRTPDKPSELFRTILFSASIFCKDFLDLFCPPPSVSYDPPITIYVCYIARYYVKIMHVRLGVIKHIFPLSGGGGLNRSKFSVHGIGNPRFMCSIIRDWLR